MRLVGELQPEPSMAQGAPCGGLCSKCPHSLVFMLPLSQGSLSSHPKIGVPLRKTQQSRKNSLFKTNPRTSLVVQWLRPCAPKTGGPGLIPGQGTRSHMPQLKISPQQRLNERMSILKCNNKKAIPMDLIENKTYDGGGVVQPEDSASCHRALKT